METSAYCAKKTNPVFAGACLIDLSFRFYANNGYIYVEDILGKAMELFEHKRFKGVSA